MGPCLSKGDTPVDRGSKPNTAPVRSDPPRTPDPPKQVDPPMPPPDVPKPDSPKQPDPPAVKPDPPKPPADQKPVPSPPKKAAADPVPNGNGGGGGDEDSFSELVKKFRDGGDEEVEDLDALYLQMQDEKKRRNTAVEDLDKLHKELTVAKF